MPSVKGPDIEVARKRLGIKRSELADTVGLSYKSIYGIERGYNVLSEEKAQLVANTLKIGLDDVLDGRDEKPPQPSREPSRPPNRPDHEGETKGPGDKPKRRRKGSDDEDATAVAS